MALERGGARAWEPQGSRKEAEMLEQTLTARVSWGGRGRSRQEGQEEPVVGLWGESEGSWGSRDQGGAVRFPVASERSQVCPEDPTRRPPRERSPRTRNWTSKQHRPLTRQAPPEAAKTGGQSLGSREVVPREKHVAGRSV